MIRDELKHAIKEIVGEGVEVKIDEPEYKENGDYTTNVAFRVSKNPEEIAEELKKNKFVKNAEVKNKFINIFLKDDAIIQKLDSGFEFDKKGESVNIEFVSANPTGPLTIANGRGGFYGDVLANVLNKVGYDVTREYYINDAGNQIRLLGESIEAIDGKREDKEEYYKGEYIKELSGKTGEEALEILLAQIKKSLERAGIKFDVWFSEKKLREGGELDSILEMLKERHEVEEREGAIWFGPPDGGNVLVKSDKSPTYFLADLAYHYDKLEERGFDTAIDIWGADHHGYIERMKKGVEALGIDKEKLKIVITQMVRLISGGKEVKMSKRAGTFVTMDELLEQVGVDVARWFFLERGPNTHMDFDLDLAKEKSDKNPVYYVQYAYVRMQSILHKAQSLDHEASFKFQVSSFENEAERNLALKILRYPELLDDISRDYQVQKLTKYAYELAQTFSAFYHDVKVVGSAREAELLYIVSKTKETLGDVLSILGISQPEKM